MVVARGSAAVDAQARAVTREVKSAIRVLEILEFFDRRRREATVMDVATELGYPQSSTSILLQNLAQRGYLQRRSGNRTYLPSMRVKLLGSWIAPTETPSGEILTLMQELGEATGETIILAGLANDVVRYAHVVPATGPMRLHVGPGTVRPLAVSGAGRLFMASMNEEQVRRIVARHNASLLEDPHRLSMAAVRRDLAQIRSLGYSLSLDRITPGAGVVFVRLPDGATEAPHAIAIGGVTQKIRENSESYAALIRRGIRRHLRYATSAGRKEQVARDRRAPANDD